MNTKEKTYTMALAALMLIGLSAAWAGTSYVAYQNISSGTIYDFARVSAASSSKSLGDLKKNMWFSKDLGTMFNVTGINASAIFVRVTLLNMPDLADDFRSLNINVTLWNSTGTPKKDYGVISLETGMASALLYADSIGTNSWLAVNATVYGYTSAKASSNVTLNFFCAVEPAAST
jgi:hypothetical protein